MMLSNSLRPLNRLTSTRLIIASTSSLQSQQQQQQQQQPIKRFSSHDSHSHHADPSEETYPAETFGSPLWRNSILAALTLALFFRLNPLPSVSPPWSSSPNTKDDKDPYIPFLTRYLTYHMPAEGLWKSRNEGHLELAKLAADDKLLFQEAERPKVRRMRFLGSFDQASPNGIPVGSQADLSDLKIKSEKDDFAKTVVDEEEE